MKDRIYIAGKLNSDSCGYIKNLNRMISFAEKVRKLGAAVYVPGNDFLHGLVTGTHEYRDYFENSTAWLLNSDAMALTPGWESSIGTNKEIMLAEEHNIPILHSLEEVKSFIHRPRILCIIGESGSGKSFAASWFDSFYGVKLLRSYTDRPQRDEDDNGHTFLSREDFDSLRPEDMVAYTQFGDYRYCCLHSDLGRVNGYVIDEKGFSMLRSRHGHRYGISSLRIYRDEGLRFNSVGDRERIFRDQNRFFLDPMEFDYVIENNGSMEDFEVKLNNVVEDFSVGVPGMNVLGVRG